MRRRRRHRDLRARAVRDLPPQVRSSGRAPLRVRAQPPLSRTAEQAIYRSDRRPRSGKTASAPVGVLGFWYSSGASVKQVRQGYATAGAGIGEPQRPGGTGAKIGRQTGAGKGSYSK